MPNLEEHCKHCRDLFGVEGREIHKWLDEPSKYYGASHRVLRHDKDTAIAIGKMFGKNYGMGIEGQVIAEGIFFAHIFLDIDASKKKGIEIHPFTPEQIKELEEQKAEYQQEINRAQKQIKELVQLPQLSIREMKEYLDVKLGRKGPESKQLAEVALRHWQKYLLSRDLPNREINEVDINSFVAQLRRKMNSPYTRANYLGQLVSYFKYAYSKEIAILIQKEKSKADGEIAELKKNTQPLRIRDVKRFYREANHPLKVAIRLLLLEKSIGIDDLGKINVIQEANGKYHFFQEKTEIEIDADTAKMAIPLLKCNKGKLVKGKRRSLADRFQRFSDKLHFEPNITPVDLHKFGRKLHPDDIKEFILT